MKHLLLYISLLLTTATHAQPYQDITSDWCKMGLRGKVKEMYITELTKTEKKNKIKTETHNTAITFSSDGYIKRKTINENRKRAVVITYTYKHDKEKNALAIIAHGTSRKTDSTESFYVKESDTSFSIHQMFIMDSSYSYATPKYIYNSRQQLISADVAGSKKWGTITEVYQYNKQGERIGVIVNTSIQDSVTISKYDIQNVDSKGNPIVISETKTGYPSSYSKSQHITYTYY